MAKNPTTGNMYAFVTHTFNIIKGQCEHDCAYCFMKKLSRGRLKPIRFDEKELKTDLGSGNFIFVGSSNDPWAANVPSEWIKRMLDYCDRFENRYLFQSKNPARFLEFSAHPVFHKAVFCTTIESNRRHDTMGKAPDVTARAAAMKSLSEMGFETYVTAEPIHDFDLAEMYQLISMCNPTQVNIGRNTNWQVTVNEPTSKKVLDLGNMLATDGIKVEYKSNIKKFISQP